MAPTFNAIGHAAADMAATLAFYRKLGLDIPAEADQEPHAEVRLPGGMRLMWDRRGCILFSAAGWLSHETIKSIEPGWTPGRDPGGSLAFECADSAEVDAVYAEMVQAGYDGHREPWDAEWGQRYALLRDPDGNGVDLYARLPTG